MIHKLSTRPVVLALVVLALLALSLPVFAQDGGSDWLTTSDRGMVGISAPATGAALSGVVDIEGTAQSNAFNYYKVEYAVDGAAWVSVVDDYKIEVQVAEGVLATWDTTMVPDGAYWLRAVVVDNTGNYVASEPVAVTVANEAAEEAVVEEVAEEEAVVEETEEAVAEEVAVVEEAAPAGWLTTSDRGMVGISAPAADAALSGEVDIEGTAQSNAFNYYKVEYAVDGAAWVSVVEDYKMETQVAEGVLATWDTTMVPDGAYWLRAVVVDNTGNFVASEPVAVTVANEGAAEAVVEEVAEEEAVVEETEEAVAEEVAVVEEAAPAWVTTSDRGMVGISAPAADAALSGEVDIEGTAQSNAFNYYKVEYSVDGAAWVSVVEDYKMETQVAEGVLATWDTATVDNGAYWLRAVVVDNTGNFVASEPVAVTVAN